MKTIKNHKKCDFLTYSHDELTIRICNKCEKLEISIEEYDHNQPIMGGYVARTKTIVFNGLQVSPVSMLGQNE